MCSLFLRISYCTDLILFHLNRALLMHCGCNFCRLSCDSNMGMDFSFLLHNFTDTGLFLT